MAAYNGSRSSAPREDAGSSGRELLLENMLLTVWLFTVGMACGDREVKAETIALLPGFATPPIYQVG